MAHNITQRRGSTASSFQQNGIPHRNGLGYSDSSDEEEEDRIREEEEEEEQERLLSKRHGEAGEAPSSKKRESSTDAEIQAEYARRANKRSRPTLTTAMLMGPKGLLQVKNELGSVQWRGGGLDAAARYSRNLIHGYKQFCFDLFPSMAFEDVLLKMESLGSKRELKSYLQTMRQDVCKRHLEGIFGEEKAERMMQQLEHGMKQQQEEEHVEEEAPVVENPYHTRGQHAIMESNEQDDGRVDTTNKTDKAMDSDDDREGSISDKEERGVREAGDEEAVSNDRTKSPEEPLSDAEASNENAAVNSKRSKVELDDSSDEETELLIVTGKPTKNSATPSIGNETETKQSADADESESKADGLGVPVVENPYHTRGQHATAVRDEIMESNENKTDETMDSDDDQEGSNSDKEENGVSGKEAGDEEAVSKSPEEPLSDAEASNENAAVGSQRSKVEFDDSSDEETELLIVTGKPTNNSATPSIGNDTETKPFTDGDESETKGDGLGAPSKRNGDINGTDASSPSEKTMDEATPLNQTLVFGPVIDSASGESAANARESKDAEEAKNQDDAVLFNNETEGELQMAESSGADSPCEKEHSTEFPEDGALTADSEDSPTICPTLSLADGGLSMESNETATIVPTMSTLASQNDSEILSETPTVVGTMSTQASQFEGGGGGDENKSPLTFSMSVSEAIATGTPSFPNERASETSETATNP